MEFKPPKETRQPSLPSLKLCQIRQAVDHSKKFTQSSGRTKIAILAAFPVSCLPGREEKTIPSAHYATWLPQLAAAWEDQDDFEIHWLTVSPRVSQALLTTAWNQQFHILPCREKGRAARLYWQDRRTIREMLGRIRPKIVHAWGTEDTYAWAAAGCGYPVILSMQGILSHYGLCHFAHPKIYFQALLELFCLFQAQRITVETTWGRTVLRQRGVSCPIDVVEYGVREEFFQTPWEPDPEKPVALFIGSLLPMKGIQDAVQAFRSPEMSGYQLWILGSGGHSGIQALRARSPSNVRWLGRRAHQEIPTIMQKAWCLVLPTRADSSPNVVKEARVMGLPVLTTNLGGQACYLQDGRDGYLIFPGQIAHLKDRLKSCLGDFAKTRQMGDLGRQAYREVFLPGKTAQAFLGLYKTML